MENKRDILYLVKIEKSAIDRVELGYLFERTYACPLFCGFLVNHANGKMWFEVNNEERPLVCVPVSWIEWMAQSKNQPALVENNTEKAEEPEEEDKNECEDSGH